MTAATGLRQTCRFRDPTIRNLTLYKSSLGQVSAFRVARALLSL